MVKLKLQYLGHLMWRADLLEKNLMLGKTEGGRRGGDRGWGGWRASLTTDMSVSSGSWRWTGELGMLWSTGSQRAGHYWATESELRELAMDRGARHAECSTKVDYPIFFYMIPFAIISIFLEFKHLSSVLINLDLYHFQIFKDYFLPETGNQ